MSDKELDIARGKQIPRRTDAMIDFCLTRLEEQGFEDDIDWKTEIADGLTVEEVIGALIAAENERGGLQ
jgi:hypothetical protein